MTAVAHAAPARVALRAATADDCEAIWRWNFAPDVRARSKRNEAVALADHAAWYQRRLAAAREPIWVITDGDAAVGVIRIDAIGDGLARMSIALAAEARGRGIGRAAIAAACRAWRRPVLAEIFADNRASRACFAACGFRVIVERGDLLTYQWDPGDGMATDTTQLALWRSDFGRAYTARNDRDRPERVDAWRRLLDGAAPRRVLEVGCNVGWNLVYLERLGITDLYGVEPQPDAVERARHRRPGFNILHGTAFELPLRDRWCDLVFTSGVLIHIAPESLDRALDEIYRVARRWIVAIEYDHPSEQEVRYRGHSGALWKRDHGAAWLARYPALQVVRKLALGAADGYDDCTGYLFEKPQ
ncbi:MAG TPA: pseudaminic acid biosynthesis-associated methylase [Kofleriaceae bacterium]|nr:pseudaminic acid biosynthesis-associated methylase [Kofleriaceae bacterium]